MIPDLYKYTCSSYRFCRIPLSPLPLSSKFPAWNYFINVYLYRLIVPSSLRPCFSSPKSSFVRIAATPYHYCPVCRRYLLPFPVFLPLLLLITPNPLLSQLQLPTLPELYADQREDWGLGDEILGSRSEILRVEHK
jgi:hypothetical protein